MSDRFDEGRRVGMERAAEIAGKHECSAGDSRERYFCDSEIAEAIRAEAASLPEHKCLDPETVEALRRLRRTASWIPLSREQLIMDADAVRARFRAMGVEL